MIAPERVAVSGFGRRRSLSDLAVWGFPGTFPENLPPQALFPLLTTFTPPTTLSSKSSTPQTPPSNSLGKPEKAFPTPKTLCFSSSPP